MEIITSLADNKTLNKPTVVALGTFDGLHRGHMDVIRTAANYAQKQNCDLAVFSFSNHPLSELDKAHQPEQLLRPELKETLLAEEGVKFFLRVPFDHALAKLSPEEFLEKLFFLNFRCLVVGKNFRYGFHAAGDSASLAKWCAKHSVALIVRPLIKDGGEVVSSSAIRSLIKHGDMTEAARMLGRPYVLAGEVTNGAKRGRTIGFPTANIEFNDDHQLLPPYGVYAVTVELNGDIYCGMANFGVCPTFGDLARSRLEVHIFNFNCDIYGQTLSVALQEFLRPEYKFEDVSALLKQIAADERRSKAFFKLK